jgi:hypothetical protein
MRQLQAFEKRAAVEVRDLPIKDMLNRYPDETQPPPVKSPFYQQYGVLVTTEQVYDDAGLSGSTLPSEADTMRVIRYQAALIRARERAVKSLREMRKERGSQALREPVAPVIDRAAMRRNAGSGHATLLSAPFNLHAWNKLDDVADEARRMQEAELRGQPLTEDAPADQTKPKTLSVDEIRRSLYRGINGCEMPEESEEMPATPERLSRLAHSGPKRPVAGA